MLCKTLKCWARFVDDYFTMDRAHDAEHAMGIFARLAASVHMLWPGPSTVVVVVCRLVRCLLGTDAVSDRKLEAGMPLVILGIRVQLSDQGIMMTPDKVKIGKWCQVINEALRQGALSFPHPESVSHIRCASGRMCAGEASKMAGRLTWASQACFKRLGRAMLHPLYRCVFILLQVVLRVVSAHALQAAALQERLHK